MSSETINQHERAFRTWRILSSCALSGTDITYGALAKQLGIHHRPVRFILGLIQDYCLTEKLPPLTILVISGKGKPGTGFIAWDIGNLEEGRRKVHSFSWQDVVNPFAFAESGSAFEDVSQRLLTTPEEAEEIYATVKVRGMAQQIFRESILQAYEYTCAFSGIRLPEVLDAVHITPWSECMPSERLDPRNGILMTGLHHKLFDFGYIVLLPDYTLAVSPIIMEKARSGKTGFDSIAQLNGRQMILPKDAQLWPGQKYTALHRKRHREKHEPTFNE